MNATQTTAAETAPVVSRKQAAAFIEIANRLSSAYLDGTGADPLTALGALKSIRDALDLLGVRQLERCTGEAHTNAHIDHCGCCAPRWGWCGPKVTVR